MKKIRSILTKVFILFVLVSSLGVTCVEAKELINNQGDPVWTLLPSISDDITCYITVYSGSLPELNPGIIEYGKNKHGSTGLPYPFSEFSKDNEYDVYNFYMITDYGSEPGKSYIAYCLGHGMGMHYGVKLDATGSPLSNGKYLTSEIIDKVERVLIYGYDPSEIVNGSYIPLMQGECTQNAHLMFATQVAVWVAADGSWGTSLQEQIAQAYLNDDQDPNGLAMSAYRTIVENVNNSYKEISFLKETPEEFTQPIKLKWNQANQRFEARVTDTNNMHSVPKVSYNWSDPTGNIYVEYDGSDVIICADEPTGTINSPVVLTAEKNINNGRGKLKMWQNLTDPAGDQPLGRIVDGKRTPTYMYAKAYTEGFKVRVHKDLVDINGNYGDATVKNAVYGIYSDAECTDEVARVTVGENGYSNKTDYLPYQTYYLKEISASEGTILNTNVLTINPEDAATDADGDFSITMDTENEIIPTKLEVIKYRDEGEPSEGSSATGAILRLTLNSNENETYTAIVNENGYCSFENIPYGTYTLTEDETNSVKYLKMDEQVINMYNSQQTYTYRVIVADNRLEVFLKVQKIDKDTNEAIMLEGAKFKIWDVENKEWVTLMETPSGDMISEFETNEEGYFITPQALKSGEYVIYETESPDGYYLEDDYRIPEDESKLGEGGIKVTLSTQIEVEEDDSGNLIYTAQVQERPLKGKLEIYKTGEMLTEAITAVETVKDGDKVIFNEEKATPVYKLQGLQGVTYEIYAAEDIKSPDGRVTYVTEGTLVDTITTEEDGYATTDDLYLGEYEIKEIDAPKGYTVNDNIQNVTLTNDNPYNRVKVTKEEYTNDRQKLGLTFKKVFEDIEYTDGEEIEQKALFGIYTKEPIYNYQGNEIIKRNMLIDLVWADENGDVTSEVDLPEGTYVVRELYASSPYTVSTKETEFTLEYSEDPNQEFVVIEGEEFSNTPEFANLNLIKISTTQFGNITVVDGKIEAENFDEEQQAFLNSISAMTIDELKQYIIDNEIKVVSGAKYGIYLDENCTKPLYIKNEDGTDTQKVEMVTDEYGIISLEKLPIGQYFVKELVAPAGYELSDEVVSVSLDITNKDATVYRLLSDASVRNNLITKLDIFTGEAVPNCLFEIRDENGKLILNSKTNDEGIASIPVDAFKNGKTYTYTEVEAPDIYELNTEPHEFVASFDEETLEWTGEKIVVENVRKDSTVTFEKLDVMDSTPIPNCKFELKSLETDYVVTGVTDENGVYVFEDVPYGRYTYTELEAPEEYLIDTTPHEITISEEQTRVIVTNERAPETGDIAVMMVMSIAVVSVIGIAFVMIRNKRKTNE